MKRFLWLGVVCLLAFVPSKESFTGRVEYKNSFVTSLGEETRKMLEDKFGVITHYYIDERNYKSLNEKGEWQQLYNSSTNTHYTIENGKTAVKTDAGKAESAPKIVFADSTRTILGRECNIVTFEKNGIRAIYYYDKDLRVKQDNFRKHNYSDWNKYLEVTDGAIPLKIVMNLGIATWVSEAVKVEAMALTDKDFVLPNHVKVK